MIRAAYITGTLQCEGCTVMENSSLKSELEVGSLKCVLCCLLFYMGGNIINIVIKTTYFGVRLIGI